MLERRHRTPPDRHLHAARPRTAPQAPPAGWALDTYCERGQRGRVFVGEKGATMRRGNFHTMWAKAIKAAGLPKGFHFHDLRHTGSTWAADSGASLRDLMDRMGQRSMRAALIYMHANRGASRAIAAGIDRQLSAAAKKPTGRGRARASGT